MDLLEFEIKVFTSQSTGGYSRRISPETHISLLAIKKTVTKCSNIGKTERTNKKYEFLISPGGQISSQFSP